MASAEVGVDEHVDDQKGWYQCKPALYHPLIQGSTQQKGHDHMQAEHPQAETIRERPWDQCRNHASADRPGGRSISTGVRAL